MQQDVKNMTDDFTKPLEGTAAKVADGIKTAEIAAIGKVLSSVGLIRDSRKRKRLLRRVREEARSVELGLKAKGK
jgi:hypothetical protein